MSETLVTYSYATTFTRSEYGYGMCLATITFVVSLIIVAVYSRVARTGED